MTTKEEIKKVRKALKDGKWIYYVHINGEWRLLDQKQFSYLDDRGYLQRGGHNQFGITEYNIAVRNGHFKEGDYEAFLARELIEAKRIHDVNNRDFQDAIQTIGI